MDYTKARELMKLGAAVRRALWLTSIKHDARGQVHWVLPAHLAEEYPDTVYVPTKIDAAATDWEVASIDFYASKRRAA